MDPSHIRNFCIIAHIDHGKSTLADRLLEATGTVDSRHMTAQFLDSMDLERERGITIKGKAVRMDYRHTDGEDYQLNLIDTPGHVDFSYEVSRALAACEGAVLVVDASQGIQAQTLANAYLAAGNDLTLIPLLNKIDLPGAEPQRVSQEIEQVFGFHPNEQIFASAKQGIGITKLLTAIVENLPSPQGVNSAPLQALIFDSYYDPYKGVVALVRVFSGSVRSGQRLLMIGTNITSEAVEVGYFLPTPHGSPLLSAGEVGYIATGLKNVQECRVGDTITLLDRQAHSALPGYAQHKPMVFAGLYPSEGESYENMREALEKLRLNDAALTYEPETSPALGFGYRCGFLGLLHMEIVQERLEREYNLNVIATAPSVGYLVGHTNGREILVANPSEMPLAGEVREIKEPWLDVTILAPSRYIGPIMDLTTTHRGVYKRMEYISSASQDSETGNPSSDARVLLQYDIPLGEVLVDFYNQLKSRTQGYASLDYSFSGYRAGSLVKLDVLLNGENVDALCFIVHREKAYQLGRDLVERLRRLIPRQLFEVAIQAAIGSRVIARESVRALRKDVLAKCYGGDITRKRKLLEKQAEGKKRLKRVGQVEVPQEAFLALMTQTGK
jgi:GTP-binding protein LepA